MSLLIFEGNVESFRVEKQKRTKDPKTGIEVKVDELKIVCSISLSPETAEKLPDLYNIKSEPIFIGFTEMQEDLFKK